MEIRSYRRVFDLERRIYRIDSLRLNPGGVPVRGIVYFLAALLAVLMAGRAPLIGSAVGALPWYLSDLAFPGLAAMALGVIRIEGRPFHQAAHAVLRYRVKPRHLVGTRGTAPAPSRWRPDEITLLPDGSDGAVRALRYRGPGAIRVASAREQPVRARLRWGARASLRRGSVVELSAGEGEGAQRGAQVIVLERGARMSLFGEASPDT